MPSLSFPQLITITPAAIFLQSWTGVLDRVWHYINDTHHIGSVSVSGTRLIIGALIFAIALLLSRTLSNLPATTDCQADLISIPDCATPSGV